MFCFAVRGEHLAFALPGLPGRYTHVAHSMPHSGLRASVAQNVLRSAAGLGSLHMPHLPNIADWHDGAVGVPGCPGTAHARAAQVWESACAHLLQRLSQGNPYTDYSYIRLMIQSLQTSKTKFHFIGLKCVHCGAYNTTQDVKRRLSLVTDEPSTAWHSLLPSPLWYLAGTSITYRNRKSLLPCSTFEETKFMKLKSKRIEFRPNSSWYRI